MKTDLLKRIEKLDKADMFKIRGGKEKPKTDDEIIIIRKRRLF